MSEIQCSRSAVSNTDTS